MHRTNYSRDIKMITSLQIKNFKSHEDTNLELRNLTVLCGQNGVGKSSVIQSLLLLRQTDQIKRLNKGLQLNKPLCEIGAAQDALYQYANSNSIELNLLINQTQSINWKFAINDRKLSSTFIDLEETNCDYSSLNTLSLFNSNFQYLSAARLAPKESYEKDTYEVEQNRQLSKEKGQAELIAHFLSFYEHTPIGFISLQHPSDSGISLLSQTTAWEKEISKNINVQIIDTGKGYEIKYNFSGGTSLPTHDFKAENVGFGVTYALPLIVAILSAQKDSLILIENPEAHLHPYGQSKLAELIALGAQAGIQIIVETHSDHIINGILVASKQFEEKKPGIDKCNVKIYYFDRDETKHAANTHEIKILEGGKIDHQPDGFFDQIQNDLEKIMGF